MKYKVMIVEDQTMPRELFELRIQASERFEVALSIDNAALAEVYCLRFPVDLILMDVVTRGGESGLDAAERIKRTFPQIKIIIVTSMPECSYLSRAREIGVESFWYKEEQRESLLDVMTRTMAGEFYEKHRCQYAKHAFIRGRRTDACGNRRIPRGAGSARKNQRYLLTLPGHAGGYSADGGQPSSRLHAGKSTESDRVRTQGDAELQIRAAV